MANRITYRRPAVGLEVPGHRAKVRDRALKATALRLLDQGYRQLVRDVFNLAPGAARKVKPGMETIAPQVKQAARDYNVWFQELRTQPDGTLNADAVGKQLEDYRNRYEQLRTAIAAKAGTKAPPGSALYTPPAASDWDSWTDKAAAELKAHMPAAALGGGVLLLVALGLYLLVKSQSAPRIVVMGGSAA